MELENIQSRIYELRGQRVMIDRDLAGMYQVETKVLNQAVKRNIERFPEDFMFQLTEGEVRIINSQIHTKNKEIEKFCELQNTENEDVTVLRSQFVTAKQFTMSRTRPYAFTENGVAMLSSVLKSPLAIQVNIGIMRAFTEFRKIATAIASNENVRQLRHDFEELKLDIQDILADQNDINESTRLQLDAISKALAELQTRHPNAKPRRPIGFILPKNDEK